MKWLSWRAGLIEFILSWEIVGLSVDSVKTCLSNSPAGFKCIDTFDDDRGDGQYAKWVHSVPSSWPGTYTSILCSQTNDNSSLRVCINATPNDTTGYPSGLTFLATLLELPHKRVQSISLSFGGDGYGAEVVHPLTEEQLHLLLGDVGVEMDVAIDDPWQHVGLDLSIENRSDSLFIRRLG